MRQFKRVALLLLSVATMLVAATTATAATAPGYEEFSDCPDKTVDPTITGCATNTVTGGHLQLGTKDTPLTDPLKLTVGLDGNGEAVIGSFDGGHQRIPGGLVGITGLDWLVNLFPGNLLQVYAAAQLAGPDPVLNPAGDPTISLKVRLENPLLSSTCFIGSDTNPLVLNLTAGTTSPPPPNQPISGQPGTISLDPNLPGVVRSTGITFVDNAFAAPAAQNCDLLALNLVVTTLVNAQAGLPAAAGTNEAVQEAELGLVAIETVFPPNGIE